jgi:hypothetical protein
MHSTKGYRRHYELVDFEAAYIDEKHKPDCEAKLISLNARAEKDNFLSRQYAEYAGAVAIFNSGIGAACRCIVQIRP